MHGSIASPTPPLSRANRWLDQLLDSDWPYTLLIGLCLLMWLPGFFTIPPSDRDESRFAQASKQMLETGDFVSIRNGNVARNQKPIGIYWLQLPGAEVARAAGLATANPIWPYRLPSLIGGIFGVCATFGLGQTLVGRRAGLLGAAMLATSMVLVVETHIAKTDAALLGATTVAMGLLARAYLTPHVITRRHWVGFWIALGAGILVKGPVAPMVVVLTALTLVITDALTRKTGPYWLLSLQPKRGVALMLLLVLPWFIAIAWRTHGTFFAQSLGGDLASKLAGGDDSHGAPPGMHLLLLSVTLFPSGWVVLAALPATWRARRLPAIRFLLAWIIPAWLVFEAVPTKLPHYPLPLFPALCLLGATWALEPLPTPDWLRRTSLSLSVAAAGLFGLLALVLPFLIRAAPDHRLLGIPALLSAGLIMWLTLRHGFAATLFAAPLLIWSIFGIELPALPQLWIAPQVALALHARWPAGVAFAASGFAEPSLMFLCGTDTTLVSPVGGAHFLQAKGARALLVDSSDLPAFAAEERRLGVEPIEIATFEGYNYSRGKRVHLYLFSNNAS